MLGRPHWLSSLRCQSLVFNIGFHRVLELMSREGGPQGWQLLAGFQPPEAFCRLHHGGPGPAQRHGGILPAFDVAADAADRAVHVLDDVGAGQRAAQFGRQAQAADGEDFIQPFQNAAGNARGVVVQAAGKIAEKLLGFCCIAQFPRLPQRLAHACLQKFGVRVPHLWHMLKFV